MGLKGKKIAVLGNPEESQEVCEALKVMGAEGIVYHDKDATESNLQDFFSAQFVILAGPEKTYQHILDKCSQKNIPIRSKLDLLIHFFSKPLVAVTGTNGKSTVGKLIETLLIQGGKRAFLAGGPFASFLAPIHSQKTWDLGILVLGSRELQRVHQIKPKIAVLTNLVPAHYERHQDRKEYFASKSKIFTNQTKDDLLIYNADNEYVVDLIDEAKSEKFPFFLSDPMSYTKEIKQYAYSKNKTLYYVKTGKEPEQYSQQSSNLLGQHQAANALAAIAVARHLEVSSKTIQKGLEAFPGLPHRMELILEKGGKKYYDDARSANPAATAWGLTAFHKPVVLIMGGLYMGARYSKLIRTIEKKVKLLILFGNVREKIYSSLKERTEIYLVETLEEAVVLAIKHSQSGDHIVLSPGNPPDPNVFSSYEQVGASFRANLEETLQLEMNKKRLFGSLNGKGIKI